jgi:DNA repair protein RadC
MYSALRSRSTRSDSLSSDPLLLGEPAENSAGQQVQGLAGEDLANQWDAAQFALRGRDYSREFMTRMHHPFGEVLGALLLDTQHKALAYLTCFRGERPSALSHLPGITQTAQQAGAACVVLAYNMIFDPNATLPDVRRIHARMDEAGVELHDFLLINPGHTRSLLAPALL